MNFRQNKNKRILNFIVCVFFFVIMLSGCASVSTFYSEGADLRNPGKIYVIHFLRDKRGLQRTIAGLLRERGYDAIAGEATDVPSDIDVIVTYEDSWKWSLRRYIKMVLTINFNNAKTGKLIATAKSSLPSSNIKYVINNILDELLNEKGKK